MAGNGGTDSAASPGTKRVFLSYPLGDKDFAWELARDLEKTGLYVWMTERETLPGDSVPEKIKEGISICEFFCVVISIEFEHATRAKEELSAALIKQMSPGSPLKLIPVLLKDAVLPEPLKYKRAADFADDYDSGLGSLLRAMELKPPIQQETSRGGILEVPEPDVQSQDEKFLEKFTEEIEKTLSDPEPDFSLEKLSYRLGISRSALFRNFERLPCGTPHRFIMDYRLKRGAQLLKRNYGNVEEVASEVGFSDPKHFSKCFKEKFKQPPKDYRKAHLKTAVVKASPIEAELVEPPDAGPDIELNLTFSLKTLDGALLRSVRLAELERLLNAQKGTPQMEKMLKSFIGSIASFQASTPNASLQDFHQTEIVQKMRKNIEELKEDAFRSGKPFGEHLDFFELENESIRRNSGSVAAVCLQGDLNTCGAGFFQLETANFKEAFNMDASEPFLNQPVAVGTMCTGFLVGEDVIATVAHFANEENISQLRFLFGYVMPDPITPVTRIPEDHIYKGVEILQRIHNPDADWALVKLDRKVRNQEIAMLSEKNIYYEQPIYVIGHALGLPLKYSPGAFIDDFTRTDFTAALDIYSSNSGSPIFCKETHKVIGIVSRSRPIGLRWTGHSLVSLPYPDDALNTQGSQCTRVSEFANELKKA